MGKIKDAMLPLQGGDSGYLELHGEDFFFLCTSDRHGNSVKVTHDGQGVSRNYVFNNVPTRADVVEEIEKDWKFWFGGNLNVWGAKKSMTVFPQDYNVNLLDKPHSSIDPHYNEKPVEGEALF